MKFIMIFGPQAVGKMTVGHELEKITDLKLFHGHMTIELVSPFFSYGSKAGKRLVNLFRKEIFEEFAKSDQEGLIFTYVLAFNEEKDWDYAKKNCDIFRKEGGEIYLVELEADLEERLERNKHPYRLSHKPTKRNLDRSEKQLKESMNKYRLNSRSGEIKEKNYIKIDNTSLDAEKVAKMIKDKFKL